MTSIPDPKPSSPTNRRALLQALGAVALAAPSLSFGQERPAVTRIVVPFAPGNALDASARQLAEALRRTTGRNHIVDNKPGAGAIIGTAEVARAKPDGSVLLFTTGGHTTNAVLYGKLPYDSQRDFTPVSQVTSSPGFVMLVRADAPYRTLNDLITTARAKPGSVSFASFGTGNTTHLVGELFARAANLQLVHVPYKGSPVPDLLGGHVDFLFIGTSSGLPLIQEGKTRGLAVTSASRIASLPEVPSVSEFGLKGVDIPAWSGLWGPKGMSPALATAIRDDVAKAVLEPAFQESLKTFASTSTVTTPRQFSDTVATEIANYKRRLEPLGIKLD